MKAWRRKGESQRDWQLRVARGRAAEQRKENGVIAGTLLKWATAEVHPRDAASYLWKGAVAFSLLFIFGLIEIRPIRISSPFVFANELETAVKTLVAETVDTKVAEAIKPLKEEVGGLARSQRINNRKVNLLLKSVLGVQLRDSYERWCRATNYQEKRSLRTLIDTQRELYAEETGEEAREPDCNEFG